MLVSRQAKRWRYPSPILLLSLLLREWPWPPLFYISRFATPYKVHTWTWTFKIHTGGVTLLRTGTASDPPISQPMIHHHQYFGSLKTSPWLTPRTAGTHCPILARTRIHRLRAEGGCHVNRYDESNWCVHAVITLNRPRSVSLAAIYTNSGP